MKNNIVRFETVETKFLRQVLNILNDLNTANLSASLIKTNLQLLEQLSLDYIDCLPDYFIELLDLLQEIITSTDYDTLCDSYSVNRAILLGNLLNMEPSIELYYKLSVNEFDCLYQYDNFSEETLLSIVEYLTCIQDNQPIRNELACYFENLAINNTTIPLLWIGFSKLPTTEHVYIEAIKHVKLFGDDFIYFCKEILDSCNNNENVFLALIERVEKQKISKNKTRDQKIKAEIYATILLCEVPSENVVKRIIEVINPENTSYYAFFYEIMSNYPKNMMIYSAILKKINRDELSKPESLRPYLNRLRLLASNI